MANFALPGASIQTAPAQSFFEKWGPLIAEALRSAGGAERLPFMQPLGLMGRGLVGGAGELGAQLMDIASGDAFNRAVLSTPQGATAPQIAGAAAASETPDIRRILQAMTTGAGVGVGQGLGSHYNPGSSYDIGHKDPAMKFLAPFLESLLGGR